MKVMMVGNKCEMDNRQVEEERGLRVAKEHNVQV